MNSLIDVRPKKSLALLLIAIILGIIATPFLTRRTRISALDLCGHAFSDIEDTGVVKLNVELSSEPYIAPENAWLKAEAARYGPALEQIPETLRNGFTMNGQIALGELFLDQAYLGGNAETPVWTHEQIDELRRQTSERKQGFTYDNTPLYSFFDKRKDIIRGKSGLVIGSENPWLESMLLEHGAQQITTLEFGKIESQHPQIQTYTPKEFTFNFLQGRIKQFDFAFSYSSIEHDGLGRYGDILNPDGDLETMSKLLTILKPGGYAMIGVPCCQDGLVWNAHRIYGPIRLRLLFSGFKILGVYPPNTQLDNTQVGAGFQPVWLLQNHWGCRQKANRLEFKWQT